MRILIGQSYFRVLDVKELERRMPYPPLGALYAATILKQMGHEIIFYDAILSESPDDFNFKIKEIRPDLLLIYDDEFNYLTKMCLSNMRDAAVSFIKTAKSSGIPAIIYSSDATDFSQFYLDAGVDAIIYGEAEKTIQEVIDAFDKNSFYQKRLNIDGLIFSDKNSVHKTRNRTLLDNLDSLPFPNYSFVEIDRYKKIWYENHGYYSLNISTTRGCPYKCNWCAKPLYGKIYNSRSPENAAAQIKELKEKYSIDHLWITDDIFGLKTNWIKNFSEELDRLKIKIPYKCLSRPDLLLKGDTIKYLKNSGCEIIWIGAESGSQKILDAMDKGTEVEQIYEAAKKVKKNGMEIAFFIQFGYTGENWGDIRKTRKMISDCIPDDIGISVSYPLPGTVFYARVKEEMKNKTNWTDSDDLDMMFSGTYEKSFYKILHHFVHTEYRINKIIKKRDWKNIVKLPVLIFRFVYLRLKLNPFLKEEILTPSLESK
jgi:anaerobic magnesium-protoporphyrin IX monomethyl ester cyclase